MLAADNFGVLFSNPPEYMPHLLVVLALIFVFIIIYIFFIRSPPPPPSQLEQSPKHMQVIDDILDIKIQQSDNTKSVISEKIPENMSKIIINDISNNSFIQIKYTTDKYTSTNLKPQDLHIKFDNIFFKIAEIVDDEIKESLKKYTIEKVINKYKKTKNYFKHIHIYDTSNTLDIILNYYNINKPMIQNKLVDKKNITKNIDDITKLISINTKKKDKTYTDTDTDTDKIQKKNYYDNINNFIQNINQSINESLQKASITKDKKHMTKALDIIKFRSMFIKTNKLLDNLHNIDKSNLYLTQKTIYYNKKNLDILYTKILSS